MYSDFREVLARKDIDAVMIATPEHWHTLIGIEAARQGKNIYCEKPIGVSVAEAKALREAVKRTAWCSRRAASSVRTRATGMPAS